MMIIPADLLKDKKVLLGVTGSIAVYKSLELTRMLVKAGANVKVVMSESAKKFVTPLTFETLTSNQVLDDTNESWVNEHNHIKATQWADIFLIAPTTANTIAKLANGIADNMLLQCALAFNGKKIIAPSANTNMLQNPTTQTNLKTLKISNYTILATQTKELACKTVGDGAMAESLDIFWASAKELLKDGFWDNREVILTGGGTIEKIDDVRFISNFSSGKMASAIATALYCRGAHVSLISSKFDSDLPNDIHTLNTQSTKEMYSHLNDSIKILTKETLSIKKPYLFMVAAVSDYIPASTQEGKLKKDALGDKWNLELKKNRDILNSINKNNICVLGFKAEMDEENALKNATNMLTNKNLDAVCLNLLEDSSSFGTDTNAIEFISKKKRVSIPTSDKLSIAFEILKNAKSLQE